MGKNTGASGKKAAADASKDKSDDAAFVERASELKEEGNKQYSNREFKQALATWEQALKLVPEGHVEQLTLHCNRAAAYLQLRQYVDCVEECSTILRAVPDHPKALARRAKAYDATAQYGKALKDLDALTASAGDAGEDLTALHERVRTFVADPSLASKTLAALPALPPRQGTSSGGGQTQQQQQAAAAASAAVVAAQQQQQQQMQPRVSVQWVKANLGDDMRLVGYPQDDGLLGLKAAIAKKWGEEAAPLVIKTVPVPDKGGDGEESATVSSSEQLLATLAAWSSASRVPRLRLVRPGEEGEPPYDSGLLDEWILDFATLVREHLGIDAESHLDLQGQGMELCASALADTTSAEAAAPQFEAAEGKLRDAAAFALFNWGNVHMCLARKRMEGPKVPKPAPGEAPKPAPAPPAPSAESVAYVQKQLEAAETRFHKALSVKPDLVDVRIALAQHLYERARLLASMPERGADTDAAFLEAHTRFAEVVELLPNDLPTKPAEDAVVASPAADPADGAAAPEAVPEHSQRAQVYVMWGNLLYEHSQARVRSGRAEWQPILDEAVSKFQQAGCNQADIDAALAIHASKA